MNSFKACSLVEADSFKYVVPLLQSWGTVTQFGPNDPRGDFLVVKKGGSKFSIEVKAEDKHTGNLFIEEWSNRTSKRLGWLNTLTTDFLIYGFLDNETFYCMRFETLKTWMDKNRHTMTLTEQTQHYQDNDTWGYLVNVERLKSVGVISRIFKREPRGTILSGTKVERPKKKRGFLGDRSVNVCLS